MTELLAARSMSWLTASLSRWRRPSVLIRRPVSAVLLLVLLHSAIATPPFSPLDPVADLGFQLRAEWSGPCESADAIDVNAGNAAAVFVVAAYCQVTGSAPNASTVSQWEQQLLTSDFLRRIDVVRILCQQSQRDCRLNYSSPWTNVDTLELTEPCMRPSASSSSPASPASLSPLRDLGAIMMFFFNCPLQPNCGLDWANTHQLGMDRPSSWYSLPDESTPHFLNPDNAAFWYRELQDAQWSGLQFAALNVYGPDINRTSTLSNVNTAMDLLTRQLTALPSAPAGFAYSRIRIAAFFDSWAWGQRQFGPAWYPAPNLTDTETAAERIYTQLILPFFSAVNASYLYRIDGRPALWLYNAGTLRPASAMGTVIAAIRRRFVRDFLIQPFVVLDTGFGQHDEADGQFQWDTLTDDEQWRQYGNMAHSMVKWDSLGRDSLGSLSHEASDSDKLFRMHKGAEILLRFLNESAVRNVSVGTIATFNDLGEGTGIARQTDLYYQGQWLPPAYFLHLIRQSQCRSQAFEAAAT